MSSAGQSWYEASARDRIALLADPGSFVEFLGPERRETSPHLPLFGLPVQFDDGIVVGSARFAGNPVFLAAQEGRFMGGSFGEIHGAKLAGLLRAACVLKRDTIIAFDTGGVRLQEANAGELAVAQIIRALVLARFAGVRVIGLIGGRSGCYGGGGLIAGCCSAVIVSEQGRISVTGPEVIETNMGVEEFDSHDRSLIWRTMGGKHRMLTGGADIFVEDEAEAFRTALSIALKRPGVLNETVLGAEQKRLEQRLAQFSQANDALDIWAELGIDDPMAIPDMPTEEFVKLASLYGESANGAR